MEAIFGEVFRFLMKSFEEFFMGITVQTRYGKKRIKVDLKQFEKSL